MDSPHALSVIEVPDGSRNRASNNSQAVASFFNISASEAIQLGKKRGKIQQKRDIYPLVN
jgi:hypothetical protein